MFTSREPAHDGSQGAVGKAGIWRKLGKGRYFDLNWLRPPKQQIALEYRIYRDEQTPLTGRLCIARGLA
jgi:hypothetical protein